MAAPRELAALAGDAKDAEIARLHGVIAQLDEDRDRLAGEVDRASEALALMRKGEATSRQHVSSAEGAAAFASREILRLSEAVEGKDREIASLRRQLEAEKARGGQAAAVTLATRQELVSAAEDLTSMTRENQLVAAEAMQLRGELADRTHALTAAQGHIQVLQMQVTDLEADKMELMSVYRAVCEERQRFLTELDTSARLRQQLEEKCAALSTDIGRLQGAVAAENRSRQHAERTVASLETSLEATTRQLAAKFIRPASSSTVTASGQCSCTCACCGGGPANISSASGSNPESVRQYAALIEARAEAEAALAAAYAAQLDRDAAIAAVTELREQVSRLESVAAEERTAHMKAEIALDHIRGQMEAAMGELASMRARTRAA